MKKKKLPEEILKELCCYYNLTLSCAESCTGGLLSARIVKVPGSSSYFMGSIVAYSNKVKEKLLKVKKETLEKYGAVSEKCALEMVLGVTELLNTNLGISITGIAGPGGETPDKPVGLTYIGIKVLDKVEVFKFIFKSKEPDPVKARNDRRKKAAKKALVLLNTLIKEYFEKENSTCL